MIELQTHSGFYRCEAYGFAEWLVEIQGLIQKGYEFDFESNSNYPMQIGHIYTAILKPKQEPNEYTTGGLIPDEQKLVGEQPSEQRVYPGGSPDTPEMTPEPVENVLPVDKVEDTGKDARPSIWDSLEPVTRAQLDQEQSDVALEETIVPKQETDTGKLEVDQPAKRGPKPKNK